MTNDWIQRITFIFLWVYIKGEKYAFDKKDTQPAEF
jgi:3-methyladenine DNA glycosylase AlkD